VRNAKEIVVETINVKHDFGDASLEGCKYGGRCGMNSPGSKAGHLLIC
jgi:hypothetical protein